MPEPAPQRLLIMHGTMQPGVHPPPHQPSPAGSASATPPQGGSDGASPGSAGVPPACCCLWWSLSFRAALQAATTSAVTTTARPKESQGAAAGRSRWRRCPSRKPSTTHKTGNMVYIMPRNRARSLVQRSRITPPLRGSRREGAARSRAGGGQTPPPVSDYQRYRQRQVGGGVQALEGFQQVSWRTFCRLHRTCIMQASINADAAFAFPRAHAHG